MNSLRPPAQPDDEIIRAPFYQLLGTPEWQREFARWLASSETFAELEDRRRRLPTGHVDSPGQQLPKVTVAHTVTLQADHRGVLDSCSSDGHAIPAGTRVIVVIPDDCGDCGIEYRFLESLAVYVLAERAVEVRGPAGSPLAQRIADAITDMAAREAGAACRAA